ncbi:MAG: FkbM family methyltransferase [Terriglobia bacterium]
MQREPGNYLSFHFSIRHRLIAKVSGMFQKVSYTQRHGLIKGMKRQGGMGFVPAVFTKFEEQTQEFAFFSNLKLNGKVAYDIGAFEGIFTLFFSRRAKMVIAYEPNPASYRRAHENLRLNGIGNVTLRQAGVSDQNGALKFVVNHLMPGGASAEPSVARQIGATSKNVSEFLVNVVRLDDDIRQYSLPAPDFVKIDVEGLENAVLRGMVETIQKHHPEIYIEVHGSTYEEKEQTAAGLVSFLAGQGYGRILHIESGKFVTLENSSIAREGHIYCPKPTG